jgi:hypothetical protein
LCGVLVGRRDADGWTTAGGVLVGVGLKATLVALLPLPLLRPGLEQYEGKGISWRVLVYPLACLAIPLLWRATGSRRPYRTWRTTSSSSCR